MTAPVDVRHGPVAVDGVVGAQAEGVRAPRGVEAVGERPDEDVAVEVAGDDAVLVHGHAAHEHLVLDDAHALARRQMPDAARPVPAAGRQQVAGHRHALHLVGVPGQRLLIK